MEEEVKTLMLNDKEFAVVDELEYKGKKYMYLVELTGEEIQIVEDEKTGKLVWECPNCGNRD